MPAGAGEQLADVQPEARPGFFRRLRENLSKTREALGAEVHATLFDTLDDETWERLEEALIMADVGASTTAARSWSASSGRRAAASCPAASSSRRGSSSCSRQEGGDRRPADRPDATARR